MSTTVPPLKDYLAEIPEFRKTKGKRYKLLSLLLYVCAAMLGGRFSQAAIAAWGEDYGSACLEPLGIHGPHGPSQSTIHRLFKGISRESVEQALCRWAKAVLEYLAPGSALEPIAVDGKTLCGSAQQGATETTLLSAVSQRLTVVLGQVAVPDTTNETGVLEKLLALMGVAGRVITTDALQTQRHLAQAIVDGRGDYLQVVKDNQPQLLEDIATLFEHPEVVADTLQEAHTINLHGDRIEERHLSASTALVGYTDWPGLQQVLKLQRQAWNKEHELLWHEITHGVTSLSREEASAAELLKIWRGHWHIENKLHYVRDVTCGEDRSQVRESQIPQVMAAFRNVTLSLLRLYHWTNIAAACRRYAARPALALAALGIQT
jgi:predicted transposase YbfD/YdcC